VPKKYNIRLINKPPPDSLCQLDDRSPVMGVMIETEYKIKHVNN